MVKPLSNLLALIVHVQYNLRQSWSGVSRSSGKDISVRFHILALLLVALPTVTFAEDEGSTKEKLEETVELNATLDQALPKYVPLAKKPSGTFEVHCSPLTIALFKQWGQRFEKIYPNVNVNITQAVTNSDLATNIGRFREDVFGTAFESSGFLQGVRDTSSRYHSWPVIVAFDQLEVIVHPENPMQKFRPNQLAWIYSTQGEGHTWHEERIQEAFSGDAAERKKKAHAAHLRLEHPVIYNWEELLETPRQGVASPIHIYSREPYNDDARFLELRTVGYPEYSIGSLTYAPRLPRDDLHVVRNAAAMVRAVANDRFAIGYVSHSVDLSVIRAVPVEGHPVELTGWRRPKDEPYHVELPVLARPVFLWVTLSDDPARTPAQQEFLKFILSHNGQKVVADNRFFPLPADLAGKQLKTALKTPEPPMKEVDPLDPFDSRR